MPQLKVAHQSWPLAKAFTISRGSRTSSEVVIVEIHDGDIVGRAECMPYARYDETVEGVIADIKRRRCQRARRAMRSIVRFGTWRRSLEV